MTGVEISRRWPQIKVAALGLIVAAKSVPGEPRVDRSLAARVNKRLSKRLVAVIGVFALCVSASAVARGDEGFTLPVELQGRARVVKVQTPSLINPGRDANVQAETPVHPSNIVVEVINDEAVARGRVGGQFVEAPVFVQMLDSGYGYFHDNEPDTMQWHQMIMGNGFVPGNELSSWMARVYVSSYNYGAFDGTGGFTIELWDGDPLGIQDTTCNGGAPAPIAGTSCTFTDLPEGFVYDLKCVFPAKVPIPCDRAFGVVYPGDVCRWAWRMSEGFITGGAINSPQVGAGDFLGAIWGCDQHGYCDTASGYNAGFCCDDVGGAPGTVACDHTDADENNWIPAGGGCNPGVAPHATFCNDGTADYYFAYGPDAPVYYNNFVGAAYAPTDMYVSLKPVSADTLPESNPTPDGWRIAGNEIILADPGRPVWLEVRIGDWDLDQTGRTLKSFQAFIESSSYTSGDEGTLETYVMPCQTQEYCEAVFGGGSTCGIEPWFGRCKPVFYDYFRTDSVFYGVGSMCGGDLCVGDLLCWGGIALDDPIPSPGYETYAGSLVLWVPPDAEGTFTIDLVPRYTSLMESHDPQVWIPLLGTVPAKITIGGSMIDPLIEKSRYLSFVSSVSGAETALRVTFKDLPAPYDAWNDVQMWVGPPVEYCENSGQRTPPAEGCGPAPGQVETFMASTLQCEPYYMDWGALDAVQVFHEGVVSEAAYDIQSIYFGDDPAVEANYTFPTELTTSRWGDLVKDCTTYPCGKPDGTVGITTDVTALLDKYKNLPGAPMQVRADLVDYAGGVTPDQRTTIRDVVVTIEAYLGIGYPFTPGPPPCVP